MARPPSTAQTEQDADPAFRQRAMLGVGLIVALVGGIGGWAGASSLSGAVIAGGQVVVDSSIKKVQHPTGGVVGIIRVRNGDVVNAGDVLVRLDDTQTRANLDIVLTQLTEYTGRKARLAAERDGASEIAFPPGFAESYREAERVRAGEKRLFEARAQSVREQKGQLRERIGQYQNEIKGIKSQEKAKSEELRLVREELTRVEDMYNRQLLPMTRLLQMQREVTRIAGEDGALISQMARSEGQISETELRIIELEATFRSEAQKELREIEGKIGELVQRQIAAEDTLMRIDIKAPQSGMVHEMTVHTVGGVINAGELIMGIVPLQDEKVIEVRIAPTDIDQVVPGQKVVLRFPAFNQRTTPELKGSVTTLASDVTKEAQTNVTYYTARVKVDDADMQTFKQMKLVAGMPVEGFIQTGERTALSYLVKPFRDQLARAFREE